MSRYRKLFVEGRRVLELSHHYGMGIFAMKVSGIPVGVQFNNSGNGWGVMSFIEWDCLRFDLRAGEGLDKLDGFEGVPVGAAGSAAGDETDLVESFAVEDDELG